ncbi:ATPase [Aureococcus anophagefferens]|nr:ATPase [Aureococcus anophagefferens]
MSYMPQEDVLYPSLTVKQTLYYSSFLRCPEKWSREAKRSVGVILKLNLKHVENGIVGDHTTKGSISGGQKRRLSAAIEFLSFRPVMLMGEPASGLDSPARWRRQAPPRRGDGPGPHEAAAEVTGFLTSDDPDGPRDYPISFMTQYRLLLLRSVHIWVCDPSQGPLVWGMTVFSTIMYASAYFSLHDSVSRELAIITFVMFIYQAASTPLCVVMPLERAVVLRDYRNGVFSTAPYWLARATLACINGVIISFLACAIVYPCLSFTFKNAMIPFKFYFMTTLLMSCCMLLGLIIGISSPALRGDQDRAAVARHPDAHVPGRDILESPVYFDISEGNVDSCVPMMFLLFGALFAAGFVVADLAAEASEPLLGGGRGDAYGAASLAAAPASVRAHAITLWRDVRSPGKKATLHDVSVSFEAKTTTALMGPSGAGKTTLIDVLTGRRARTTSSEGVVTAKADVVVGSTEKPGISGGQKKRVSIGMDLLANCSVMCLGEPTTGLGAAAALSIADVVMSLAKVTGRTMVCTIHQPTWELISRFDQLTILVQGRLAFCEQPAQLAPFFAGGGHPCPDNENPIDFAMPATGAPGDAFAEPASRAGDYDAVFGRYPTSAATQYWILLKRCTLSYLKDEDQSVEHVMPSLMQALVTGLVYLNFSTNLYLATGMCFGVMGACMIAFNAFLLNIPFEKALIVREYKNGSYGAAAYWASRMTLASVSAACVAFVTPFIWWPLMGLPLNEPSRVTSEPIISLLTLTGGTMLTRPQIKVYWMWLYYLNPLHYCYEIVVTQGFQGRHGSHKPEDTLDYFHYGNGHMGANFTWLITIYVVIAAAGFIVVPRFMGH